jgi:hypothetical protein
MQIKVEIDDKELQAEITNIIAKKIAASWSTERNLMKRTIADSVKEVVYSQKKEIINMVVNRASAEIVRKGMPKLVDKMMED